MSARIDICQGCAARNRRIAELEDELATSGEDPLTEAEDERDLRLYRWRRRLGAVPYAVRAVDMMLSRPGRIVRRDELVEAVALDAVAVISGEKYADTIVCKARSALRKVFGDPIIETVRARGHVIPRDKAEALKAWLEA